MDNNTAKKLQEAYNIIEYVDDFIYELFEQYEEEMTHDTKFDTNISCDYYDNSISITFKTKIPYPYEPCDEIRKAIYNLGFDNVYWIFGKDTKDVICNRVLGVDKKLMKDSPDEIRNNEPRHNKYDEWVLTKYGYVDKRFDEKEWIKKYNFKK